MLTFSVSAQSPYKRTEKKVVLEARQKWNFRSVKNNRGKENISDNLKMFYYEKLNKALKFLADKNKGSFIYYRNEEGSTKHDRLETYLLDLGIPKKEILPIINQLAKDGYIDVFYSDVKHERLGEFPLQIKICYEGMRFINEIGGYKPLNKKWYVIYKDVLILFAGAVLSAGTGILATYLEKSPEPPRIIIDTEKCDSLVVHKNF